MALPRLHIITDTQSQKRFSHLELSKMAFNAGDVLVQYRNKYFDANRDLEELKGIVKEAYVKNRSLVINDDLSLAGKLGTGVHLGQEDPDVFSAREELGSRATVGGTVHNFKELYALKNASLDYIGVGPVFGTRSKKIGLPDMGLKMLSEICKASGFPVIAIGGITIENVNEVLNAGAYGIAVISAFCNADDPESIAKRFLEILDRHPFSFSSH